MGDTDGSSAEDTDQDVEVSLLEHVADSAQGFSARTAAEGPPLPSDLSAAETTELLRIAAKEGFVEAARALLEAGAEAGAAARDGFTPLALAALGGHQEMVRLLVKAGVP